MATITQLPACCFLENIPQISISGVKAGTTATVSLVFNGDPLLLGAEMSPDKNGEVTLLARQMIRDMAVFAVPGQVDTALPRLVVSSAGKVDVATESYIVPGGIDSGDEIGKEWFARNFLTWQPQILETTPAMPQWLAFVPLAGYGNYTIKSTLYAVNGRVFDKEVCVVTPGYRYVQIDTSFAALWKEFCLEKEIEPFCYDVYGSVTVQEPDVHEGSDRKSVTHDAYPYTQRYRMRPERIDDVCFGFVNTLGGFDTLMMQGKVVLKPEGDIGTFVNGEVEAELANAYTSYWETSSGYLDNERTATQVQDFLKSASRWAYDGSQWRRIIVDEYKVEHTPRELNAYTFKYHLAERNERRYCERVELPDVELPTKFPFEI